MLEDAPDYTAARFDLACALAKAGQEDAALKTMTQVFCEDLPTNLPRALEDEDLAALRDRFRAEGERWVTRYKTATVGAMALVGYGQTRGFFGFSAGGVDGGGWVNLRGSGLNDATPIEQLTWLVSPNGVSPTPNVPTVRRGPLSWKRESDPLPPGLRWNRSLRIGERTIEIEASHRVRSRHEIYASPSVVLLCSDNTGDCVANSFVMSLIDRERGESLWHREGTGQAHFRFEHGKLWMQQGDRMYVFPDPIEDDRQELPSGLGLSSAPDDYNPYC